MQSSFKGKKVLVLGLGLHGGGIGAVRFFARRGSHITVTDIRPPEILKPALKQLKSIKNIRYVLGRHEKKDILDADLIVKNPGVRRDSTYIKLAERNNIPITTDLGIFFRECPGIIIGVTGTRGKSTTAMLIAEFLKTKYPRVFLGGNIRKSALEFLEDLKKGDLVVLELSSFQLADLAEDRVSPPIAVFTNIYRDHLNWHKDMKDYITAKSAIFKFQTSRDYLFANLGDPQVKKTARSAKSRLVHSRLKPRLTKLVAEKLGSHYVSSAGLAVGVAKHFKIPERDIEKVLKNFHGLESRQQEIGVVRGAHVINDTTSTIPDATIAALMRFRSIAGRNKLILIAGGTDKNLEFKNLARAIKKYADGLVLLPGTATNRLTALLKKLKVPAKYADSMETAVKKAFRESKNGDYILFSPGATSFGMFNNEFHRGDAFIKSLKKFRRA